MPLIREIKGIYPTIHPECWVADNATITGDVHLGDESSVWYQAVIRGDVNKIRIGNQVNIQDAAIVHGSRGGQDTILKDHVSIGHRALIHGCTINSWVLVGMGAIIMDDVLVNSHVIIGAGSVVTQGKELESGWIYTGTPAKKLKPISIEDAHAFVKDNVDAYVSLSRKYMNS